MAIIGQPIRARNLILAPCARREDVSARRVFYAATATALGVLFVETARQIIAEPRLMHAARKQAYASEKRLPGKIAGPGNRRYTYA